MIDIRYKSMELGYGYSYGRYHALGKMEIM